MTRSCFFGFLFLFFTMRFIFHPNFGEYVLLFPNIKQANLLSTCFGPPLPSHRCWSFWRKCLIIRSASVFSRFVGGSSSQFSYVRMTLGHFLGRGLNHFYQGIMITHPHCFFKNKPTQKMSVPSLPCLRHFLISWIWWFEVMPVPNRWFPSQRSLDTWCVLWGWKGLPFIGSWPGAYYW